MPRSPKILWSLLLLLAAGCTETPPTKTGGGSTSTAGGTPPSATEPKSFPDEEIHLYGADSDSGTFDFFTEAIVGKSKASRTDYNPSADDNQLVNGVSGDKYALGYIPYSYYLENKEQLKAVGVKAPGSSECVTPSAETVDGGKYKPLSRPLFLCINKKALAQPHVKAFVSYYLTAGQVVVHELTQLKTLESELKKSLEAIGGAAEESKEKLAGTIQIDGSSSVFPLTQGVVEEFRKSHPDVTIPVARSGTGGGFKKFAKGEIDINDASRPIKDSEKAECQKNGIEFVEVVIATDAITLVVSNDNDFCECLSVEQLKAIWEPDSKVKKWSEIK